MWTQLTDTNTILRTVILTISIVVAIIATAFMITMPKKRDSFRILYLAVEGKTVDFPASFPLNSVRWITIGSENHE